MGDLTEEAVAQALLAGLRWAAEHEDEALDAELERERHFHPVVPAALDEPGVAKAGPPDEPRDDKGQWTAGGAVPLQPMQIENKPASDGKGWVDPSGTVHSLRDTGATTHGEWLLQAPMEGERAKLPVAAPATDEWDEEMLNDATFAAIHGGWVRMSGPLAYEAREGRLDAIINYVTTTHGGRPFEFDGWRMKDGEWQLNTRTIDPKNPDTWDVHKADMPVEYRDLGGLRIGIENPGGSIRHWGPQPHQQVAMGMPYGFVDGVPGMDGDSLDIFLGPMWQEAPTLPVLVVTITKPPGYTELDEEKVFVGWPDADAARRAFLEHFGNNPKFIGKEQVLTWGGLLAHCAVQKAFNPSEARDDKGQWTGGDSFGAPAAQSWIDPGGTAHPTGGDVHFDAAVRHVRQLGIKGDAARKPMVALYREGWVRQGARTAYEGRASSLQRTLAYVAEHHPRVGYIFWDEWSFPANGEPTRSGARRIDLRDASTWKAFNPDQARDDHGRWSDGGGEYARAGAVVDGREVMPGPVPNTASIGASLTDYEELPGIREVPMAAFPNVRLGEVHAYSTEETARVHNLAQQIKASGAIAPLIVVVDHEGPYILEGGHRFDALALLRAKAFPALVVVDKDHPGPVRWANAVAKAFNPDEARDEKGKWTVGGEPVRGRAPEGATQATEPNAAGTIKGEYHLDDKTRVEYGYRREPDTAAPGATVIPAEVDGVHEQAAVQAAVAASRQFWAANDGDARAIRAHDGDPRDAADPAAVNIQLVHTLREKDVGAGSSGPGSSKVFWAPYSVPDRDKRMTNANGYNQSQSFEVDPVYVLVHELHHSVYRSDTEFDRGSEVAAMAAHLAAGGQYGTAADSALRSWVNGWRRGETLDGRSLRYLHTRYPGQLEAMALRSHAVADKSEWEQVVGGISGIGRRKAAKAFNPDEARDDHGRWTEGGGVPTAPSEGYRASLQAWAAGKMDELRRKGHADYQMPDELAQFGFPLRMQDNSDEYLAMAEHVEKASSREAMVRAVAASADTWGRAWAIATDEWQAAKALGANGATSKTTKDAVADKPTLTADEVAAFKARQQFVQDYVRAKYGDTFTVYRGVTGAYAKRVVAVAEGKEGGTAQVAVYGLSSWAERGRAYEFASTGRKRTLTGAVLSTEAKASDVWMHKDLMPHSIVRFSDDHGEVVLLSGGKDRTVTVVRHGVQRGGRA